MSMSISLSGRVVVAIAGGKVPGGDQLDAGAARRDLTDRAFRGAGDRESRPANPRRRPSCFRQRLEVVSRSTGRCRSRCGPPARRRPCPCRCRGNAGALPALGQRDARQRLGPPVAQMSEPSSASSATSTPGPRRCRRFRPRIESRVASSLPSPITILPSIATEFSVLRIASHAADRPSARRPCR